MKHNPVNAYAKDRITLICHQDERRLRVKRSTPKQIYQSIRPRSGERRKHRRVK